LLAALGRPGAAYQRIDHGRSGDIVLRLESAFAKIAGPGEIRRQELAREAAALEWLARQGLAPRLLWSQELDGRFAILTEALSGTPLHDLPAEDLPDGVAAALRALSALHALPAADCPFDERVAVKLTQARRRTAAGEVDETDFDAERAGCSAAEVLAELEALLPIDEDLVVTHGDASWPNIVIGPEGRAAFVDLGRFGVADRHQDLALFIRSAVYNAPELDAFALLAKHYPAPLDARKRVFFQILDEFF
jgi:aminoglycoside phosphotransferase